MRNAARLKMGYYPLPESEGVKLRSLLSFTGPASVIDPCVGQGTALHLVTSDAPVRRYGVELDAERARIASANGIETIQGNAFDAIARPESFSLLYLNPPYDSEIGSIANRRMEAVFLEHTYRWLAMEGVLILVIPFERLHDCAGILSSHFASLERLSYDRSGFGPVPANCGARPCGAMSEERPLRTTSGNSRALASMAASRIAGVAAGRLSALFGSSFRRSGAELSRPPLRPVGRPVAAIGRMETGGAAADAA